MLCKLRKNGNSWSVIIPIEIARPFIPSGFIDVEFPSDAPVEKIIPENSKAPEIDRLRKIMDGEKEYHPYEVIPPTQDENDIQYVNEE
jgi:hypothetical protein